MWCLEICWCNLIWKVSQTIEITDIFQRFAYITYCWQKRILDAKENKRFFNEIEMDLFFEEEIQQGRRFSTRTSLYNGYNGYM